MAAGEECLTAAWPGAGAPSRPEGAQSRAEQAGLTAAPGQAGPVPTRTGKSYASDLMKAQQTGHTRGGTAVPKGGPCPGPRPSTGASCMGWLGYVPGGGGRQVSSRDPSPFTSHSTISCQRTPWPRPHASAPLPSPRPQRLPWGLGWLYLGILLISPGHCRVVRV